MDLYSNGILTPDGSVCQWYIYTWWVYLSMVHQFVTSQHVSNTPSYSCLSYTYFIICMSVIQLLVMDLCVSGRPAHAHDRLIMSRCTTGTHTYSWWVYLVKKFCERDWLNCEPACFASLKRYRVYDCFDQNCSPKFFIISFEVGQLTDKRFSVNNRHVSFSAYTYLYLHYLCWNSRSLILNTGRGSVSTRY